MFNIAATVCSLSQLSRIGALVTHLEIDRLIFFQISFLYISVNVTLSSDRNLGLHRSGRFNFSKTLYQKQLISFVV